jgi:hypothetical protein
MREVLATLVNLFARRTCAEIEGSQVSGAIIADAFGADSFDQVVTLPFYAEEYSRVRAAKLEIERIGDHYSAHNGDQPLQCLCLLKEWRGKTKHLTVDYGVRRDLIQGSLLQNWSPLDQTKYDTCRRVIEEWTDFFLSYTNRDALEVNNRYRRLINHKLGWPGTDKFSRWNYVARVIAKFLEAENLRTFVDFKNLECGDDIEQKIVEHCRSTFAFVQLIERVALSEPPEGKFNWCHIEFQQFQNAPFPPESKTADVNRRFFFLSGSAELTKPAHLSEPYEPWYEEVSRRLHIVIDTHDRKPWDELKCEVSEVAKQIVTARSRLVDAMLARWP